MLKAWRVVQCPRYVIEFKAKSRSPVKSLYISSTSKPLYAYSYLSRPLTGPHTDKVEVILEAVWPLEAFTIAPSTTETMVFDHIDSDYEGATGDGSSPSTDDESDVQN